jgi:hypothetical protein
LACGEILQLQNAKSWSLGGSGIWILERSPPSAISFSRGDFVFPVSSTGDNFQRIIG